MDTIKETVVYEKTHNKTGQKYVGISTRNTNKYNGSGPRWIEHLEEHGYDHSTDILFKTTSQQELTDFCETYSKEKNIVESDLYSNERPEHGGCLGGEANPNFKHGKWVGRHDDKEKERRVQKEEDAIKYERDKDLFIKSQMKARSHKSNGNREQARYWFNKWQAGIRGGHNNGQSLQKTDTFEFWYQCEGRMSWGKRKAFYG